MFQIGQRVICINAAKQSHTIEELNTDVPNWVQKDKVYTVKSFCDYDFVVGVYLEEITNPPKYFKLIDKVVEPAFATWRFRALAESEVAKEVEQLEKSNVI